MPRQFRLPVRLSVTRVRGKSTTIATTETVSVLLAIKSRHSGERATEKAVRSVAFDDLMTAALPAAAAGL